MRKLASWPQPTIDRSANGAAERVEPVRTPNIIPNKHQGIRAAVCWGEELAQLCRSHNNANVICIPARFVREGDAEKMVELFIHTEFEGGRHELRVDKIACA